MHRRTYISSIATGVAGLGAGALLAHSIEPTDASATVSTGPLSISGVERTTEDGTVSNVYLTVSGEWSYQVPSSKEPDIWQVVAMAGTEKADRELIAVTSGDALYLDNSGAYELEGTLLDSDAFSKEMFAAPAPGDTTTQDVWLGVTLSVFNPSEEVIALAETTDTATVQITEAEYKVSEHGSLSGTGSLGVSR